MLIVIGIIIHLLIGCITAYLLENYTDIYSPSSYNKSYYTYRIDIITIRIILPISWPIFFIAIPVIMAYDFVQTIKNTK